MGVRAAILVTAVLALAGCRAQRAPATQASTRPAEVALPPRSIIPARREIPKPPSTTLLSQGPLPLLYQFGAGGRLRLFDSTARQLVWTGVAAPDALIAVTGDGVLVSGQRVVARPLDPRHQYELWWDAR